MTVEQQILLALLALPLIGAVVVWNLGPERGQAVRYASTLVSVVILILAGLLACNFMALDRPVPAITPGKAVTFRPVFTVRSDVVPLGEKFKRDEEGEVVRDEKGQPVREKSAIQFYLGIDGLNIWLVVLTAVLLPSCVL